MISAGFSVEGSELSLVFHWPSHAAVNMWLLVLALLHTSTARAGGGAAAEVQLEDKQGNAARSGMHMLQHSMAHEQRTLLSRVQHTRQQDSGTTQKGVASIQHAKQGLLRADPAVLASEPEFQHEPSTHAARHRACMRFLKRYMPQSDIGQVSEAQLTLNVDLALQARYTHPWAVRVPWSLFLNDVLPYASLDEPRDDWRPLVCGFFCFCFVPALHLLVYCLAAALVVPSTKQLISQRCQQQQVQEHGNP